MVSISCNLFSQMKFRIGILDTFFRQIKWFLRFRLAFVFGLQTYYLIDFSKIYQLNGLEPKNKRNLKVWLDEKIRLEYMHTILHRMYYFLSKEMVWFRFDEWNMNWYYHITYLYSPVVRINRVGKKPRDGFMVFSSVMKI